MVTTSCSAEPKYIGFDIIDEYECGCGWKSGPFYDGAEYAYAKWRRHITGEPHPIQREAHAVASLLSGKGAES